MIVESKRQDLKSQDDELKFGKIMGFLYKIEYSRVLKTSLDLNEKDLKFRMTNSGLKLASWDRKLVETNFSPV